MVFDLLENRLKNFLETSSAASDVSTIKFKKLIYEMSALILRKTTLFKIKGNKLVLLW